MKASEPSENIGACANGKDRAKIPAATVTLKIIKNERAAITRRPKHKLNVPKILPGKKRKLIVNNKNWWAFLRIFGKKVSQIRNCFPRTNASTKATQMTKGQLRKTRLETLYKWAVLTFQKYSNNTPAS